MDATKTQSGRASSSAARRSTDVREAVRRRSVAVYARTRLTDAIRSLALDICGGDAKWISAPVNEATEEALRVLIAELADSLDKANPHLTPTMLASAISRTDFE